LYVGDAKLTNMDSLRDGVGTPLDPGAGTDKIDEGYGYATAVPGNDPLRYCRLEATSEAHRQARGSSRSRRR